MDPSSQGPPPELLERARQAVRRFDRQINQLEDKIKAAKEELEALENQAPRQMASNVFPSFLDTSNNTGTGPRLAPSPLNANTQQSNVNGNHAGATNALPMGAGNQMDVNFLYQKVVELSEVLRDNREKTQGIVAGAEELAVGIPLF